MEEYVAKSLLKKELNIANLHSGIVSALQNIVDEIPAADVQEVKHAHWGSVSFGTEWGEATQKYYICSNCDFISGLFTRYCPNCGTKMDGKDEELPI